MYKIISGKINEKMPREIPEKKKPRESWRKNKKSFEISDEISVKKSETLPDFVL